MNHNDSKADVTADPIRIANMVQNILKLSKNRHLHSKQADNITTEKLLINILCDTFISQSSYIYGAAKNFLIAAPIILSFILLSSDVISNNYIRLAFECKRGKFMRPLVVEDDVANIKFKNDHHSSFKTLPLKKATRPNNI